MGEPIDLLFRILWEIPGDWWWGFFSFDGNENTRENKNTREGDRTRKEGFAIENHASFSIFDVISIDEDDFISLLKITNFFSKKTYISTQKINEHHLFVNKFHAQSFRIKNKDGTRQNFTFLRRVDDADYSMHSIDNQHLLPPIDFEIVSNRDSIPWLENTSDVPKVIKKSNPKCANPVVTMIGKYGVEETVVI